MKIEITACSRCPFFGKSLLSLIASMGSKSHNQYMGACSAPQPDPVVIKALKDMGQVTSEGKTMMPIDDNRIVPKLCPLRAEPIHVEYGGEVH